MGYETKCAYLGRAMQSIIGQVDGGYLIFTLPFSHLLGGIYDSSLRFLSKCILRALKNWVGYAPATPSDWVLVPHTACQSGYEMGNMTPDIYPTFFFIHSVTDTTAKSSNYRMRLKFNFTAKIKSGDSVEAAEFHMYKGEPAYAWMRNASFVVELFVITIPGTSTTPTNLRKKLGTRVMQGWETGWEVFDITSAVDMWIISPLNNYGLEVTVKLLRTGYSIPAAPGKFGLVGFTGPLGQRPFIVSFFKGDPTDKGLVVHASSRKKRSLFNPAKLKFGNTASSTECKKRRLYVDFQELRWQNWIIAPDGYESSYCAGECNYAMYAPRNATNHAIVQTLVNLLNPDSAPSPCCAPTKLKAISVLFYDENKNVVLKKFQDMVVMSCGCR